MTMEKRNTVEDGRTPEKQIKECKAGVCGKCVARRKALQKTADDGTGSITDTDNLSKEFDK